MHRPYRRPNACVKSASCRCNILSAADPTPCPSYSARRTSSSRPAHSQQPRETYPRHMARDLHLQLSMEELFATLRRAVAGHKRRPRPRGAASTIPLALSRPQAMQWRLSPRRCGREQISMLRRVPKQSVGVHMLTAPRTQTLVSPATLRTHRIPGRPVG